MDLTSAMVTFKVALADNAGLSDIDQAFHERFFAGEIEKRLTNARWWSWKRGALELSLQIGDDRFFVGFLLVDTTEHELFPLVVILQ